MTVELLFALCACLLIGIGLYGLIVLPHPLRKLVAFNIMGSGVFVLFGLGAMLFLALKAGNLASFSFSDTYEVRAKFDNIGGLKARAPVRSAGVVVGRIVAITL